MNRFAHLDDKKLKPGYRFIRHLVWMFSPKYKIYGEENLPEDGPCVIVGNHSHMYGPIAGELYIPGKHATWCIGDMMDPKTVSAYAYRDFWSKKPLWIRWFFKILSYIIPPIADIVFNSAHTIPVYHDMRIVKTFKETTEELSKGVRVVIFPECYDEYNNIVHMFQNRFIDIAKMYRKKTGKDLTFVPMYLAPLLKRIEFGKPIKFDSEVPAEEERERIAKYLMDEITALAAALPEHTVVPYPNVSKKHYPKSLPIVNLTSGTASDDNKEKDLQ
ncbi:MAG: hypothetical protein K6E32_09790 [Lachnospiraceae bacterium]|nr:hypothetical protein [Lachnospiraceae bacterium]